MCTRTVQLLQIMGITTKASDINGEEILKNLLQLQDIIKDVGLQMLSLQLEPEG
ncbi:hypothetical protein D3C80_1669130 [compost metagenome]